MRILSFQVKKRIKKNYNFLVSYCNLNLQIGNKIMEDKIEENQLKNKLSIQLKYQKAIFSNFQDLTELLRKEIGPNPDIPKIKKIIESFQLNPKFFFLVLTYLINYFKENIINMLIGTILFTQEI